MIKNSVYTPDISQLQNQISSENNEHRNIFRDLLKQRIICKEINGQLHFRHDRIRDYFFIGYIKEKILKVEFENTTLNDPYYVIENHIV